MGTPSKNLRLKGYAAVFNSPSEDMGFREVMMPGAFRRVLGDSNTVPESEGSGFVPATDAFVHTWRPQLTVPAMDFGSVKLGASKTKTFTITFKDLGGTPANFGPISFGKSSILGAAAADYKILATTCDGTTLHEGAPAGQPLSAAAESCTFKIRFEPTESTLRVGPAC